jgi:hypothetical protein
MMMPGSVFSVSGAASSYIRTSYAYASDAHIDEGFRYAQLPRAHTLIHTHTHIHIHTYTRADTRAQLAMPALCVHAHTEGLRATAGWASWCASGSRAVPRGRLQPERRVPPLVMVACPRLFLYRVPPTRMPATHTHTHTH